MSVLLSVVLPTHDRADDVGRAATSVLSQDFRDLELIVVDDASSDSTPEVLDQLADRDQRVRVIRNDSALGPCEARNVGLAGAKGELVGFCDDDDAWLPGAARLLVEFVRATPGVAAASSWHEVSHSGLDGAAIFRGPLDYGAGHLLWQNFVALPFGVINRSALSFEVRFDPELPTGEDWDLWLRCSQQGSVRTLPQVCYRYNQHGRPRVTRTADAQVIGRRNFLAKHGGSMTPACRLYHRTVLAGYLHGRAGMGRALAADRLSSPRDKALVSLLLASSMVASRVGQRRGDPGLQARLMASLVSRGRNRSRDPR